MGFSKDLFMEVRAIEESNRNSLNAYCDDYHTTKAKGNDYDDDNEEIKLPWTNYRVGYKLGEEWHFLTEKANIEESKKALCKLYFSKVEYRRKKTLWLVPIS